MTFLKKNWEKIKSPKIFYAILFYVAFAGVIAGTIALLVLQPQHTAWHYVMYVLSAIGLTYTVYTVIYFAPKMKNAIICSLQKYKFTNSLLTSFGYRTLVFSAISLVLNISYVVFVAVLAFMTKSAWYISITIYYLILILMKTNIFRSKSKYNNYDKQIRTYRFCGIMFILLMLAFSGIIVLIYKSNMYFEYAGLMIYAVAVYTFYKLVFSIINIFKARKQDDLYVQSIRNINLVSALISVIVLQVAMFQAFSPENNASVANGLTGGLVALLIFSIGIFMIIKSNKTLKTQEIKNEQQ